MLISLVERVKIKIKEVMRKKGLSVYELAKKADLTEACIRNWYTKRDYTPSLEAIEKICRALDIPETELVKREDEEFLPVTPEEKQLLSNWKILDEKQRKIIIMQMEMLLSKWD